MIAPPPVRSCTATHAPPGDAHDAPALGPQDLQVITSTPHAPGHRPRQDGGTRGTGDQCRCPGEVVQRGGGEEGHEHRRDQVDGNDEPPPGAAPPGPGTVRPVGNQRGVGQSRATILLCDHRLSLPPRPTARTARSPVRTAGHGLAHISQLAPAMAASSGPE